MKVLEFVFASFIMLVFLPIIWFIGKKMYLFLKTLLSDSVIVSLANNTQKYIIKSK